MVQVLFCLSLQYPKLHTLAICSDKMVENLTTILFHFWTDKIKAAHDEQIVL